MASIINSTTTAGVTVTGDNSGSLQLATNNGTTAVTVNTSQNIGVGIASPTARLHVYGGSNNQFKVESSGAEANFTLAGTSYGQINNSVGDLYLTNDASANMILRTASTERMRITSAGNLEFASGAGFLQLATNQTMRVPSSGGIGYVGNINSSSVFQIAYNSTSAGVQLSSGATSWGTFSDSRLKNITGTYTNALNDIAQIQPVKFTWKADEDSKPQVGVIAQSIQNVVPEAVDSTTIEMDGTEEYLTVRYTELIPLMIASIQELNAKVEAQAVRIAELEGAK